MSSFLSGMPMYTGETERDIKELNTWACKLVTELRTLLYSLDTQNVTEARKVKASGISGKLNKNQIPCLDTISVKCGTENGIRFVDDDLNTVASIYYDNDNEKVVVTEA